MIATWPTSSSKAKSAWSNASASTRKLIPVPGDRREVITHHKLVVTLNAAIRKANPEPSQIAILQLDTLAKFAESPNAKIVVPFESAALLGATQALKSVMDGVPTA